MLSLALATMLLPTLLAEGETWWSCRPLEQQLIPGEENGRHPIDRFLAIRQQELGIDPAPRADDATLIRRATYDLTGLAPQPDDAGTLENEEDWIALVDRLLASDQYGVRWGRHWLDLVRWAETDSYERDRIKPHAWRYRDWVVDAFNTDMPYDRFVLEQLAGDELPDRTLGSMVATGYHRLGIWDDEPTDVALAQYDDLDGILDTTSRVMLGLSMGCARCHAHKKDPILHEEYYSMLAFFHGITPYKQTAGNSIDPVHFVRTVNNTIHDPDIEAVRQAQWRDEHQRLGETLTDSHAEVMAAGQGPPVIRNGLVLEVPAGTRRIDPPVQDDFTVSFRFRTDAPDRLDRDRSWWMGRGLVSAEVPGIVHDWGLSLQDDGRLSAGTGNPEITMNSQPGFNDGQWHHVAMTRTARTGDLRLYIDGTLAAQDTGTTEPLTAPESVLIGRVFDGYPEFTGDIEQVTFHERALPHREIVDLAFGLDPLPSAPGSPEHEYLVQSFMDLHRPVPATTDVLCVLEPDTTPPTTYVLNRGNPHAPGDAVLPAFPTMLGGGSPEIMVPAHGESSGRRLALARWITDPDNLRTARVMVNRIWQHHFGEGLVPTPNDFGHLGLPPSHPELLDWLALEFIKHGWSIKAMHRLIMQSEAYRRSGRSPDAARRVDPMNRGLTWFPMRRLEAEELRDSILQVNGTLNLQLGGPSVYPPMPEEVLATSSRPDAAWNSSPPDQAARRSLYIHVKRSLLHPMLTVFDLADTDSTCPVRFSSLQPTQALTMLNSDFINEQADLLALRLERDAGDRNEDRLRQGYQFVLQRAPDSQELASGLELLRTLEEQGMDRHDALKYHCLVLLNLNEFIFID
ncbi:MAG: DUF1553 domain-containing protein [Phycisphaerales bacterium]|nr:DUF1553 domain-containing protein [Phycisphaerales bacterium]